MSQPILGLDIGGTNIKIGLVKGARLQRRAHCPTVPGTKRGGVYEQIRQAIWPWAPIVSRIGIGCAGIIDSARGVVRYSPNLGWRDFPLGLRLAREFKIPVWIINDVNAILLGEWRYGAARQANDVFLLTIGTGVGGAAICNGKMVMGANGFAGELGHTTINFRGPRCTCGQRGCLESYVGTKFLLRRAHRLMKISRTRLSRYPLLTPRIIAEEARRGDPISRRLFEEMGFYLGIGISNLLNLLDPALIVIAGGISRAGAILFNPLRRAIQQNDQGAGCRRYRIVPGRLGDDAGILGASYYAASQE